MSKDDKTTSDPYGRDKPLTNIDRLRIAVETDADLEDWLTDGGVDLLDEVDDTIARLTRERDTAFRWGYRALLRLAQVHLAEANANAEPGAWPAGQEWSDLGGSSRGTFLHRARQDAGIARDEVLVPLRTGTVSVEDLWDEADGWGPPPLSETVERLTRERDESSEVADLHVSLVQRTARALGIPEVDEDDGIPSLHDLPERVAKVMEERDDALTCMAAACVLTTERDDTGRLYFSDPHTGAVRVTNHWASEPEPGAWRCGTRGPDGEYRSPGQALLAYHGEHVVEPMEARYLRAMESRDAALARAEKAEAERDEALLALDGAATLLADAGRYAAEPKGAISRARIAAVLEDVEAAVDAVGRGKVSDG